MKGRNKAERLARIQDNLDRAAAWRRLSLTQQLKILDERLGVNVGATRQRNKIKDKLRDFYVEKTSPSKKN